MQCAMCRCEGCLPSMPLWQSGVLHIKVEIITLTYILKVLLLKGYKWLGWVLGMEIAVSTSSRTPLCGSYKVTKNISLKAQV